jgi:hypothetical protein
MHERRVEVAFENKRWTDLVSTGLAKQVLNAQGVKIKADQQAYYYPSPTSVMAGFLVSFYNVVDTRFLFLVPQSEIVVDPAVKQKPGY